MRVCIEVSRTRELDLLRLTEAENIEDAIREAIFEYIALKDYEQDFKRK